MRSKGFKLALKNASVERDKLALVYLAERERESIPNLDMGHKWAESNLASWVSNAYFMSER